MSTEILELLPTIATLLLLAHLMGRLSPWMDWKSIGLMGDAMAHSSLPAIALAMFIGIAPIYLIAPFILLLSVYLGWLDYKRPGSLNSFLPVVFSSMLAVGVLALSLSGHGHPEELLHILLGDVDSATWQNVYVGLVIVVVCEIFLRQRRTAFKYYLLHPVYVGLVGGSALRLQLEFFAVIGIVVAFAIKSVGIILASALMLGPSIAASFHTKSLRGHLRLTWTLAIALSLTGFFIAHKLEVSSGVVIAALTGVIVLLSALPQLQKNFANSRIERRNS
ncbi:MAG: hypothetical protein COT74_02430 [Bdellovibrionales bacterium CG10_big_fil_rev_8_21_14_0_10_45_34]|nr:MAG: hypothetical protein COT74_02430 [Bdellovibrionales bacterium CG10_big_fil_rev_8_21_14_0_10_45_34]